MYICILHYKTTIYYLCTSRCMYYVQGTCTMYLYLVQALLLQQVQGTVVLVRCTCTMYLVRCTLYKLLVARTRYDVQGIMCICTMYVCTMLYMYDVRVQGMYLVRVHISRCVHILFCTHIQHIQLFHVATVHTQTHTV